MKGAEDRLVSALKVILGHSGEKLTNTQVVEAVHVIQQRTKRKGSNPAVLKFQDVSNIINNLFCMVIKLSHTGIVMYFYFTIPELIVTALIP